MTNACSLVRRIAQWLRFATWQWFYTYLHADLMLLEAESSTQFDGLLIIDRRGSIHYQILTRNILREITGEEHNGLCYVLWYSQSSKRHSALH